MPPDFLAVDVLKDQHFPIDVDISETRDSTACWLVQYGYVTLYSPKRKIPLFGAERLEGPLLKQLSKVVSNKLITHNHYCFSLHLIGSRAKVLSDGPPTV